MSKKRGRSLDRNDDGLQKQKHGFADQLGWRSSGAVRETRRDGA